MIVTALDTNVILDLLAGSQTTSQSGNGAVRAARLAGPICVSMIVYAEVALNFPSRAAADEFFSLSNCRLDPVDESTAYLAAQFFGQYRRRGGSRMRILPDFVIAAHAQLRASRLLTRDKRFFRETFPKLKAVSPEDLI
ncbi:MAG TPA: type II toxin-antitoxin system VapC family toxin [Acidobacteriaceae bacterium]